MVWISVENLEHCDFLALRNMVIRTHLQDLKDVTSSVHYENYRCRKLAGLSHDGKPHRINSNKYVSVSSPSLDISCSFLRVVDAIFYNKFSCYKHTNAIDLLVNSSHTLNAKYFLIRQLPYARVSYNISLLWLFMTKTSVFNFNKYVNTLCQFINRIDDWFLTFEGMD